MFTQSYLNCCTSSYLMSLFSSFARLSALFDMANSLSHFHSSVECFGSVSDSIHLSLRSCQQVISDQKIFFL